MRGAALHPSVSQVRLHPFIAISLNLIMLTSEQCDSRPISISELMPPVSTAHCRTTKLTPVAAETSYTQCGNVVDGVGHTNTKRNALFNHTLTCMHGHYTNKLIAHNNSSRQMRRKEVQEVKKNLRGCTSLYLPWFITILL